MYEQTIIAFEAGGSKFALARTVVARVMAAPRLGAPPSAPSALAGFFTYADELVTVLRLSTLLEVAPASKPGLYDHVILLEGAAPRTGLLVERARAVLDVNKDDIKPIADGSSHRDCVQGEISSDDGTYLLLDISRVLGAFERERIAHFQEEELRRRSVLEEAAQ